MTESNHQPPAGDRLDRAAAAVRGEATPAPPADLTAAVLAAVHNRVAVAEVAHAARRRRRWVMRGMSVGGLAACLAVAAGVMWGGGQATAGHALKRALDNQQKAETWRAVTRMTLPGPKGGPPGVVEQTLYGRGDRLRVEMDAAVTVFADGKGLLLETKTKTARRLDADAAPADPARAATGAVADAVAAADFTETPVPAVEIGGVKRPGYRVTLDLPPLGRAVTTYYLDAERDLPLRMELVLGAGPGAVVSVTDYLGFGEDLDPKLFSLDVPAGYTLVDDTPSPAKTRPVSLTLAAEAVAAAPAVVVTNTQRTRAGGPELTVKFLLRPQQMRMEFPNPGGNGLPDPKGLPTLSAIVFDAKAEKSLHLNFGEKTAKFEARAGKRPEVPDLVAAFRDLKDADGEPAGEEKIGDVTARVFRLKKDGFLGVSGPGVTTTVWLDPATSRPVKVRVADGDAVELRFDRFEWPANLAEGLFSLTPPAGFAVGDFVPPSPERTYAVSLKVALDNEAKSKSFRAVTRTTLADPPAGMPPLPEQRLFGQGGKFRIEAGDITSVTDGTRLVLLDAKAKTARTTTVAAAGGSDMAKGVAAGVRKLLDAQDGKGPVTAVPAVEIGGSKRPGFKVTGVSFAPGQTADVTYYLDEARKLPLRWEVAMAGPVKVTAVGEYLAFDEELDPKLFDLAIPAGYAVEELKLPAGRPERPAPPPVAPPKTAELAPAVPPPATAGPPKAVPPAKQ